ncbi:MAG: phytanoyl-CoA dioxygenase family protein [Candidatus Latescibacterota bacterium]|nr:phytanoyl-CoA dioxygenase family protein [Candidatus Latescibacterota bacterium]
MDTSFTNSRKSLKRARRASTDWAGLSREQQICSIELDGYLIVPDLLSVDQVATLKEELDRLPTRAVDYSEHQRGNPEVWRTDSPNAVELVAHPPVIDLLMGLFGDEIICTSLGLSVSHPGHPGIVIHTDSQPFGSKIFGVQASSPVLARVLYYLDDLTPECSPFKVIPRSHLSMHRDGNPYLRYLSHPDEIMVCCEAGSAVIINQRIFHGNYPNHSNRPRRMLAIAYRPAWAGPIDDVPERDAADVAKLPAHIQPYFRSLNTRTIDFDLPNRPDGMAREAEGIAPARWGDGVVPS